MLAREWCPLRHCSVRRFRPGFAAGESTLAPRLSRVSRPPCRRLVQTSNVKGTIAQGGAHTYLHVTWLTCTASIVSRLPSVSHSKLHPLSCADVVARPLLSSQILFFVTCGTLAGATALKWIGRSEQSTSLLKHQLLA